MSVKISKDFEVRTFKTGLKTQARAKIVKKNNKSKLGLDNDLKIILVERGIKEHIDGSIVPCMNEKYCDNVRIDCGNAEYNVLGSKAHNAFFQFRMDPSTKARYSDLPGPHQQSAIVKAMGAEWRAMSKEQKRPFEERADQARYEYNYIRAQHQTRMQQASDSRSKSPKPPFETTPAVNSSHGLALWSTPRTIEQMSPWVNTQHAPYNVAQMYLDVLNPPPNRQRASDYEVTSEQLMHCDQYNFTAGDVPYANLSRSFSLNYLQNTRCLNSGDIGMVCDYTDAAIMHALSQDSCTFFAEPGQICTDTMSSSHWHA